MCISKVQLGISTLSASMGGLPYGVTEKDFFGGCSVPRNKEIMRVLRDLDIVEHPGFGVPRILNIYGKDAFEIRDSYLRVTFYYADTIVKTSVKLLELPTANPEMTLAEVAEVLEKSVRAIELASAKLVKAGKLKYVGPQKGGHWEVTRENAPKIPSRRTI